MPAWLIVLIIIGGYLTMVLVTGSILSYVRGRSYSVLDEEDVVLLSALWPFGLTIGLGVLTGPFWKKLFSPLGHLWKSALHYGEGYYERKRAREAKRTAKAERKQADNELRRAFIDLCEQNGWDPKQVLKRQKKAA